MHILVKAVALVVVLTLAWFGVWYAMLAGDVARVKASLAYHNEAMRERSATVNLKFDAVYATGFPFRFAIGVDRATLSMIDGDESYAISIPRLTLEPTDASDGRYRVVLPDAIEALYAKSGAAPEHYTVRANPLPELALSARPARDRCGPMTGKTCAAVASDAPLVSYAVGLPSSITLTMTLGQESRDAAFPLMAISVPFFQDIPADMRYPLEMFVRVLREALVYSKEAA
jgi:hypothetical protein